MFEWKVNQIRVDMMERVLNHMEKQGYEVQVIVPLTEAPGDYDIKRSEGADGASAKTQMLLAGKKLLHEKLPEKRTGMPAVTPENLDVVYGRDKANIGSKSA
ncbi:MAG TPA: hypothetical protein V6C89_16525 [Drouetiella sp.]|jgi:hypothetical protein